jgi:protein arginine N-methyltransferase 5
MKEITNGGVVINLGPICSINIRSKLRAISFFASRVTGHMETVSIAFEYDNVVNIEASLQKAQDNAYDYIIVPLVHPGFERQNKNGLKERDLPLTRSDMLLGSTTWNQYIVGKFSEWLNFDSTVEIQRHNARKAFFSLFSSHKNKVFKQEVAWATHLGISAAVLPEVYWNCSNYASAANSVLMNVSYMKFWIRGELS